MTAFSLFLIASLASTAKGQNSTDLTKPADQCKGRKVFTPGQGKSCASGDLQKFTISQITNFGARPAWSPDGKKIVFLDKELGNVFEMKLDEAKARCLTCDFMNTGFQSAHYLKDGDYLLVGPRNRNDAFISGVYKTGFLWMPADRSSPPKWMAEQHYEGVAVSRESRTIAYAKTWLDNPGQALSKLYTAEVAADGRIVNGKTVYRSPQLIAAQDFLPGDRAVIFTKMTPKNFEIFGLDLASKKETNYSLNPATDQVDGVFPDGAWALMESDRAAKEPGTMDLYMLKLDGTGRNVRKLTNASDSPGQQIMDGAISPDGCRVLFAKTAPEEGPTTITDKTGGIFLIEFYDCKK
jgi:Tol biopolymer transport system component